MNDWWFVSDYAAFAAGNGGKALLPDLFMRGPSATASNDGCDVATPILVCSLGRLPAAWQWEWDCLIPPVQPETGSFGATTSPRERRDAALRSPHQRPVPRTIDEQRSSNQNDASCGFS